MTDDFVENYRSEEGTNEKYRLLLEEMRCLREKAIEEDENDFNNEEFRDFLRELSDEVEGNLIVFAANDFGRPYAFYPEGKKRALMDEVHDQLLSGKYRRDEELNELRKKILDFHDYIHKVLVVDHRGDEIHYHAPAGQESDTNFITARQYVGLLDWLLNNKWQLPQDVSWEDMYVEKDEMNPDEFTEIYTF